jgi:lipopolysaccharide exporter
MSTNYQQKQSVSHSQVVIILSTVLRLVASLALTMLIGRELDPADFGFYALVITLFVMARELMDVGSTSLAVREIALDPSGEKSILERLVGLRLVAGIILGILCLSLAWQQSELSHRLVLSVTALMLPLLAVGALGVVYQLRQNLLPLAINSTSLQYGLLIGCFGLYFVQAPAWSYPCLLLVRELAGLLWLKIHAGKTLGYTVTPNLAFNNMRSFLRKLAVVGAAAAMYNLYFYVGPLLIWLLRPATEMGAYSAAFRPISQILSFPLMLMVPLLPVLTQFFANDRPALQRQAACFIPLAIGLGAIGGVVGLEVSRDLLFVLYGDIYIVGALSAERSLQILSLSFAFSMATAVVIMFLLAQGLERVLVVMCSMGLIVNLLCNFVLLPKIGFTAAAMATLATEVAVFLFGAVTMIRLKVWRVSALSLAACLLPTIVLAIAIQLMPEAAQGWPRLVPVLVLAVTAMLSLLLLPSTKRGREDLSRQAVDAVTS